MANNFTTQVAKLVYRICKVCYNI